MFQLFSIAVLFLVLQTSVDATPSKKPKPDGPVETPEPAPLEGLYLYTAGFSSKLIFPLRDGMVICIDNYPTGVNVLCAGESKVARFYVNGTHFRTEYKEPFFLAGDIRPKNDNLPRVRPWKNPPTFATIKCKLNSPKRSFVARVWFSC